MESSEWWLLEDNENPNQVSNKKNIECLEQRNPSLLHRNAREILGFLKTIFLPALVNIDAFPHISRIIQNEQYNEFGSQDIYCEKHDPCLKIEFPSYLLMSGRDITYKNKPFMYESLTSKYRECLIESVERDKFLQTPLGEIYIDNYLILIDKEDHKKVYHVALEIFDENKMTIEDIQKYQSAGLEVIEIYVGDIDPNNSEALERRVLGTTDSRGKLRNDYNREYLYSSIAYDLFSIQYALCLSADYYRGQKSVFRNLPKNMQMNQYDNFLGKVVKDAFDSCNRENSTNYEYKDIQLRYEKNICDYPVIYTNFLPILRAVNEFDNVYIAINIVKKNDIKGVTDLSKCSERTAQFIIEGEKFNHIFRVDSDHCTDICMLPYLVEAITKCCEELHN